MSEQQQTGSIVVDCCRAGSGARTETHLELHSAENIDVVGNYMHSYEETNLRFFNNDSNNGDDDDAARAAGLSRTGTLFYL